MRCSAHTTNLSATPERPARSSRASGWSSLTTPWGFPCCVRFPCVHAASLCTCCRHCPGAAAGRTLRSSRPAVSAFPERVVGSACTSSFSRFARRSLALRPAHSRGHQFVARYTEGFSHFVTSMTAPVASGWSESPGGPFTHWNAPPFTAHTHCGHSHRTSTPANASISHRPTVGAEFLSTTCVYDRGLLEHQPFQ